MLTVLFFLIFTNNKFPAFGEVGFSQPTYVLRAGVAKSAERFALILKREKGSDGDVTISWKARNDDFADLLLKPASMGGEVKLREGEKSTSLWLHLCEGWRDLLKEVNVGVDLVKASGGASLNTEKMTSTVSLVPGKKFDMFSSSLLILLFVTLTSFLISFPRSFL